VAISKETLAEVLRSRDANSGALFGRGDELEKELVTQGLKHMEAAQTRRAAAKQASLDHRFQARHQRHRRERRHRLQRKSSRRELSRDPSALDLGSPSEDASELSGDEDLASHAASEDASATSASEAQEPVEPLRRLKSLRMKGDRKVRLRRLCRHAKSRLRAQRQQVKRQREFEALPPEERKHLQHAYELPRGGPPDCPTKLFDCLEDVGLQGGTDRERAAVQDLCLEFFVQGDLSFLAFAVDLVPGAREVLRSVRQGALLKQFFVFDQDGNGFFGKKECLNFLERLYRDSMDAGTFSELRRRFLGLFQALLPGGREELELRGFQALMSRAEEWREGLCVEREREIVRRHHISARDVEGVSDDLLVLYESFEEHDIDGNGGLDEAEVLGSLLESGLVPRCGTRKARVGFLIHAAVEECGEDGMTFRSFLKLIRAVRQVCEREMHDELYDLFHGHDEEHDFSEISMAQACRLLCEIGHSPRTQQEQDAIKKLLDRVDLTPSGQLDFKAFQSLVQRVAEKLRAGQRWRENELGRRLGFGPQQMAELRAGFFGLDADGSGKLSLDEFKTKMKILGLARSMSPSEMEDLFDCLDMDGSGFLNFTEYLYFAKVLDDPEFDLKAAMEDADQPGFLS